MCEICDMGINNENRYSLHAISVLSYFFSIVQVIGRKTKSRTCAKEKLTNATERIMYDI